MSRLNKEQAIINELKKLGTYHKFKVIYGDPPWMKNQTGKLGAIQHYDLMTLEQIKQMPIKYLAADDALLFLWTTTQLIKEAIEVIESWGFRNVDEMIWDKYYLGLGKRLRHTHEPLLLGVRGNPPVLCRNQPSLVRAVRQDHSHKPEEFFPIIERMSEAPRLELFARRQPTTCCRDNWSVWGNEIDSDIYIPGYPVPRYSERATLPEGVPRIAIEPTEESGEEAE